MNSAARTCAAALIVTLLTACTSVPQAPQGIFGKVNAVQAYDRYEVLAEELYAAGDFERAFEKHQELARVGNKFSQYRMATMHQQGLGTAADLLQAYAWAAVAAELGDQIVLDLLLEIRSQLTPDQVALAEVHAEEFFSEFSIYASAVKAQRLIRDEKSECTGSRLGAKCDRAISSTRECNAYLHTRMPDRCLVLGLVGLPGVGGSSPLELRRVEQHVKAVLQAYRPGRVEFRELQVIEPTEADNANEDSGASQ